jgi:hypothetical protein
MDGMCSAIGTLPKADLEPVLEQEPLCGVVFSRLWARTGPGMWMNFEKIKEQGA